MMDDDEDFEHQLQQEADERHRQDAGSDPGNTVDSGATRVDEDGTVFEFDMEKRAWFPKVLTALSFFFSKLIFVL